MTTVNAQPTNDQAATKEKLRALKSELVSTAREAFPLLTGLSPSDWQNVRNIITNYGGATNEQKDFSANVMAATALVAAAILALEDTS